MARKNRSSSRPHGNRCRFALQRLEDRTVPAFAAPVSLLAGSTSVAPEFGGNVLTADFNGDNNLDIAVLDDANDSISVLLGNGDGTFQTAVATQVAASPLAFAAGDFDGDGFDDLVTRHSAYSLSIRFGGGDGTFASPVNVDLPYSGWWDNIGLVTGDVNSDGFDDIVTSQHLETMTNNFAEINTLLGRGDRTVTTAHSYILGDLFNPHYLRMGDLNEDGNLDVVVGHETMGWGIHAGNGDGTFGMDDGSVSGHVLADFNNDGHLDGGTGMFSVQFGNGAGAFGSNVDVNTGLGGGPPAAGDFNNDGPADVIGLNGQPGITVLLGAASGTMGPYFNLLAPAGLNSLAVGDFNGDGFDDFAATDSAAGVVRVFLNDGNWIGGTMPPPPSISISNVTVTEGNTGTQSANFTISLSSAWTQTITVQFLTASGTANSGSDFQSTGGTVTFAPGQTSQTVAVGVIGDRSPESTEAFFVNLSSPTNATIADGQGVGTILDNEPRVSINDVSMTEGDSGTKNFTFTVTLSAAYDQAVAVSFRTLNGTATSSGNQADFVAQTGSLTFAAGQTSKSITIQVKGDKKKESNENFSVELFNLSSNALFLDYLGLGTILNDD